MVSTAHDLLYEDKPISMGTRRFHVERLPADYSVTKPFHTQICDRLP